MMDDEEIYELMESHGKQIEDILPEGASVVVIVNIGEDLYFTSPLTDLSLCRLFTDALRHKIGRIEEEQDEENYGEDESGDDETPYDNPSRN